MEKAAKRLRFTSAVFHHLSAIKLQRALRAHWALESAKKEIQSVIMIQVSWQSVCSGKNLLEKCSNSSCFLVLVATCQSKATEETVSGGQTEGGRGPESC